MKVISIVLVLLVLIFFYSYFPLKYYAVVKENSGPVDPLLIMALIKVESNFRQDAVSRAGAIGLMQLMPETAAWISERFDLNGNIHSAVDNIVMGIRYLQYLIDLYNGDLSLALRAYNAGPARVTSENSISGDYLSKINLYHRIYRILYFWVG
ncbi:MAG TPA: lytic transglycosylase domain-containing protein [Pseudothermotoga sp.]|nr:lytic transglycosylase domain-containing protein [Pseudothermotoga sp.]HPP70309.1 lytic transglycosylase domain-containing protein [Pseudothermotoga sp.]